MRPFPEPRLHYIINDVKCADKIFKLVVITVAFVWLDTWVGGQYFSQHKLQVFSFYFVLSFFKKNEQTKDIRKNKLLLFQ